MFSKVTTLPHKASSQHHTHGATHPIPNENSSPFPPHSSIAAFYSGARCESVNNHRLPITDDGRRLWFDIEREWRFSFRFVQGFIQQSPCLAQLATRLIMHPVSSQQKKSQAIFLCEADLICRKRLWLFLSCVRRCPWKGSKWNWSVGQKCRSDLGSGPFIWAIHSNRIFLG